MKATMLEVENEYGQMVWHRITRKKSPEEVLKEYAEENEIEDYEIKKYSDGYHLNDEAVAYEIEIE